MFSFFNWQQQRIQRLNYRVLKKGSQLNISIELLPTERVRNWALRTMFQVSVNLKFFLTHALPSRINQAVELDACLKGQIYAEENVYGKKMHEWAIKVVNNKRQHVFYLYVNPKQWKHHTITTKKVCWPPMGCSSSLFDNLYN